MPPPAVIMPTPDPKYLRPSIPPWIAESHLVFRRACASGDLAKVTSLVGAETRNVEYLTEGLRAAVHQNRTRIADYLLRAGAVIDRTIPIAAMSTRSVAVFQLLIEHGWGINDPVLGGETVLPCVIHTFLRTSTLLRIHIHEIKSLISTIYWEHFG